MIAALTSEEVQNLLIPLTRRTLTGNSAEDDAIFVQPEWKRVPIACAPFVSRRVFDAMRIASGGSAAPDCILSVRLSTVEGMPPAYRSDWDHDAICRRKRGDIVFNELMLIDAAGRWALQRHWEDFAVLGGEPQWVETFLDAVGGRHLLIAEIRAAVEEGSIGNRRDPVWRSFQEYLERLE